MNKQEKIAQWQSKIEFLLHEREENYKTYIDPISLELDKLRAYIRTYENRIKKDLK